MNTANAPEQLLFRYGLDDGVAVVRVTGEVDVATCGLLRHSLLRIVTDEDFRGLVVNLAGVRFMDSTGIGVLVGVWRRVAAITASLALAALTETNACSLGSRRSMRARCSSTRSTGDRRRAAISATNVWTG